MVQQQKQHGDLEQHKTELLNALIGEQVIHNLGEPDDLHKVQVRRLWEDRYRVNVFIGQDALRPGLPPVTLSLRTAAGTSSPRGRRSRNGIDPRRAGRRTFSRSSL